MFPGKHYRGRASDQQPADASLRGGLQSLHQQPLELLGNKPVQAQEQEDQGEDQETRGEKRLSQHTEMD